MTHRSPSDALILDAAKVVELAERVDQKKRNRLLFRLAREVLRSDEVIAGMGYQLMMLENHLKSARASAEHWQNRAVTHTSQPQSQAKPDFGSHVSHTPRTDEFLARFNMSKYACVQDLRDDREFELMAFARQLECDLAQALARLVEYGETIDALQQEITELEAEFARR